MPGVPDPARLEIAVVTKATSRPSSLIAERPAATAPSSVSSAASETPVGS
jgi:hypothetical protein